MKKSKKDKHFIKKPAYAGGPAAFKKFIRENLQYPRAASQNQVEGTVSVHYTIDHRGKVIDAKAISSLGYGCDEEALRLVRLLTFEVPANRAVKVQFHKKVQIHFRLPKREKGLAKPATASIQYQYVMTPAPPENPVPQSYTFTIDL